MLAAGIGDQLAAPAAAFADATRNTLLAAGGSLLLGLLGAWQVVRAVRVGRYGPRATGHTRAAH